MSRSAESSQDSGACMAHIRSLSTVCWALESRGLQGSGGFDCLLLPTARPVQLICYDSTARFFAHAGIRSHSRTAPGQPIGRILRPPVAMFRD